MKRFALLLASVAFAAPALAADITYEEPPMPAPVEAAPSYNWSGFYVGGQAGVAFNRDSGPFSSANSSFVGGNDDGETGFVGGAHAGYDHQMGQFIVGAVADINYIDADAKSSYSLDRAGGGRTQYQSESSIDYLGTVRAKAGVANERVAVYGTGGLAYAGVDTKFSGDGNYTAANGAVYRADVKKDEDNVGYTVGAGVDVLATQNVSFGLEYLYTDLGETKTQVDYTSIGAVPGTNFSATSKTDLDFHSVMAKASYRFN